MKDAFPHAAAADARSGMENNLKKAVTDMVVLHLLHERAMYIGEITAELHRRSNRSVSLSFPYTVIYRMEQQGYITEHEKQRAPDGRLRQYYGITAAGCERLTELTARYYNFSQGVVKILQSTPTSASKSP